MNRNNDVLEDIVYCLLFLTGHPVCQWRCSMQITILYSLQSVDIIIITNQNLNKDLYRILLLDVFPYECLIDNNSAVDIHAFFEAYCPFF